MKVVARTRTWRPAQYFAVLGGLAVIWQLWTYAAWLAAGPRAITEFRDSDSVSWYAARAIEPLVVIMALAVVICVVRASLRERRVTIDAQICIAGLLCLWVDPLPNLYQPIFSYTSNFTNLNAWCGHMPLVVNPVCGGMPEPVLFSGGMYLGGVLLAAMALDTGMRVVTERRPGLSNARLIAWTFVGGLAMYLVLGACSISSAFRRTPARRIGSHCSGGIRTRSRSMRCWSPPSY
jgi:hypothetical protein